MIDMTISEAREDFSATVDAALKQPVSISRHGKRVAIILDPSLYEQMLDAMEEREDIAAFDEAMKDKSKAIPFDQVKKELGWV